MMTSNSQINAGLGIIIALQRYGTTTYVTIVKSGCAVGWGKAECSEFDTYNPYVGAKLATTRAIESAESFKQGYPSALSKAERKVVWSALNTHFAINQ